MNELTDNEISFAFEKLSIDYEGNNTVKNNEKTNSMFSQMKSKILATIDTLRNKKRPDTKSIFEYLEKKGKLNSN